jgi:hypothetical protein
LKCVGGSAVDLTNSQPNGDGSAAGATCIGSAGVVPPAPEPEVTKLFSFPTHQPESDGPCSDRPGRIMQTECLVGDRNRILDDDMLNDNIIAIFSR